MNILRWLWLFFLFPVSASAQVSVETVRLGDTAVRIVYSKQGEGKAFVHLHENERTALFAAKQVVAEQGGQWMTLKHGGGRNIAFHLHGQRFMFDPNRMFTDKGIEKSLRTFGAYSSEAHREVKRLAVAVMGKLPQDKVIAVHNNQFYSMSDYFPKNPLAGDVRALYHPAHQSLRNFYFVTQPDDFHRLRQRHFNVALQARKAQDDGSLSYVLGKHRYINIEAAHHALTQQVKMLKVA